MREWILTVGIVVVGIALHAACAPVTNLNTGETFVTIQQAIDDPDTQDGHIIEVDSSTYDSANEQGNGDSSLVYVYKSVTVRSVGAQRATLNGSGYHHVVTISADNVHVEGFYITGAQLLTYGHSEAIYADNANSVVVQNNVVQNNEGGGIAFHNSCNSCVVKNNVVENNSQGGQNTGPGIGIFGSSCGNNIEGNVIDHVCDDGITLWDSCDGNTILNNEVDYAEKWSIDLHKSSSNLIDGNTISNTQPGFDNTGYGINLSSGSQQNTISNNIVSENRKGINLYRSSNNEISDNTVYSSEWSGICLNVDSHDNTVLNNVVRNNAYIGITLASNVDRNIILGNEVYNTYTSSDGWVRGIGIACSAAGCGVLNEGNVFSGNYVHDNAFGIMVTEAMDCEVIGNTVENNYTADFGIYAVLFCSDTEWWELTAHIVGGGGIHVNGPDNTVTGNTVTGSGFGMMVHGGDGAYASTGNDVSNNTVSNNTTGSVSVFLSKYEWIESTASTTSTEPIAPKASRAAPAPLSRPLPEEGERSTKADGHWENTVFEPLFDVGAFGLFLFNCSTTETSNNTFAGNGEFGVGLRGFSAPEYGWEGWSNDNTVRNSDIQQHEEGVWIGPQAQDNLVHHTTIQNNISSGTGVEVEEAQGNVLYCNQIVNNGPHGVENTDGDALEAYYNWWGSANGPGADGANDATGNVLYDPWLTSPECSTSAVFRVESATGNVLADGSFYGDSFLTGSADVAEWVPASEPVEPGDVLELDPTSPCQYRKSRGACSDLVAGIVSTDPGFVLGAEVQGSATGVSSVTPDTGLPTDDSEFWALDSAFPTPDSRLPTPDRALLALIGIVPVKVTNEGGAIQPGDLLVSSSTPGYAMGWDPDVGSPCDLIGKALEPLEEEHGIILVLLTAH